MKNILLVMMLAAFKIGFSQISFEQRLEFDLKEEEFGGYSVYLFGKDGIVIQSSTLRNQGFKTFKYELYSAELKPIKSRIEKVEMTKSTNYSSYETKTHFVDIFHDKKGTAKIFHTEAKTLQRNTVSFNFPPSFNYTYGKISDHKLYVYGRVKKDPMVIVINWETGKNTVIPITLDGYKSSEIFVDEIVFLEENGSKSGEAFFILYAKKKKSSELFILKLDNKNKKQELINLTSSIEKNIVDLTVTGINNEKYILSGTYSSKSKTLAEGIYFAEMEGNNINYINYYKFFDLSNFLSYLPEKEQNKIEKKKNKKEASGKEFVLEYRIANHDLIKGQDCYYYIGEAYYPTYRYETNTTYVNGKPVTQTRRVFDGYQYTHAVIIKYSLKGEILWDQTFEMWATDKPYYAKRFIKVKDDIEESLDLVFASNNKIVSKSFDHNGQKLYDITSNEIKTEVDGDKAKNLYTNFEFWYDNYFIAYGRQVIKNKQNEDVKKKREVFFINKIKY